MSEVNPFWSGWFESRANKNLKRWGVQDLETLGLAVAEEAGELAKAILQHKFENGDLSRIGEETIDLGALCLQVLVSLGEKYGPESLIRMITEYEQLKARQV